MFREFVFDISALATTENHIRIEILPPLMQIPENDTIQYPGGPQAHIRKAAYQFGWDWAPHFAAGGIWRDVYLELNEGETEIKEICFTPGNIKTESAEYSVEVELTRLKAGDYSLIIEDTANKIKQEFPLQTGGNLNTTFSFPLKIQNPKLWCPNGTGEAFLYHFNIRIEQNGRTIAQTNQKIGIRSIELLHEKDSLGTSFYFRVNGKPLFIKGANYVPQSMFPGTEANPNSIIEHILSSNMNMIRIWGGGIYESDEFYELCDSAGILVWQDFMFANSVFPADSAFLNNVAAEAEYQVKRLRKHPCIALWCGNNEVSEAWHNWGWQKQFGYSAADSARLWNNYKFMFDTLLPQTVKKYSPDIAYWPSSPQYGRGNPKSFFNGDLHYWGVWHDGHAFDSLDTKTGRFMSEFGFQSYPALSSIEKFCSNTGYGNLSQQLKNHQKHSRGDAIIHKYMLDEYGTIPKDFGSFVYLSQILQSKGISRGLKAQRRNQPFCMGSLYWQLNDAWPEISWSGIDYYGNWKPLQYAVRRIYQAQVVTHQLRGDSCFIYTLSEAGDSINPHLRIRVMDFFGISVLDTSFAALQNGAASKLQYRLSTKDLSPQNQFIVVEYFSGADSLVSRELIFLVKDKDLNLPQTPPQIITRYKYKEHRLIIEIESRTLIRNLWFIRSDGKVARFSDNNIDIIPGEQRSIYLKTEDKDVHLRWWYLNQLFR
jgi:beta-mannosidase